MKRSEFTDEQILAIAKQGEAGRTVADLCRTHGITEQTYYAARSMGGRRAHRSVKARRTVHVRRRLTRQ